MNMTDVLTEILRDAEHLSDALEALLLERAQMQQLLREGIDAIENVESVVDLREWVKRAKQLIA